MDIFRRSRAYGAVETDLVRDRLSHAYLLLCPDARNLCAYLKTLAERILCFGLAPAEAERVRRLVAADRFTDCRIFPAAGEKSGVPEVRALLDGCCLKAAEGGKKVYVLHAVHTMQAQAQNKLLKILEEPPENTVFLLGATGEHAVLPTVVSRAKKLELNAFPEEEIVRYVKETHPERANSAREIAALSGGLCGRADDLAADSALPETEKKLAAFLCAPEKEKIPALTRGFSTREPAAEALSVLRLLLRDVLMLRLGREDGRLSGCAEETLRTAAQRFSDGALVRALDAAAEAERALAGSAQPAQCMEILLCEIAGAAGRKERRESGNGQVFEGIL